LIGTTNGFQSGFTAVNMPLARDVVYVGNDTWYAISGGGFSPSSPSPRFHRSFGNGNPGTWESFSLDGTGADIPTAMSFRTPMEGTIVDYAGILTTHDGGATWTFEPKLPGATFAGGVAVFDANRAVAVWRGGPVQLTTSGGIGVVIVPTEPTPVAATPSIELEVPRPNPFRGTAELVFTLDASSDVSLVVYDLLGREVARLADGPMPAGEQRVRFDATGLAAGVYVARLAAGGQSATRRLTLLR
jgi:hypothetical protein